MELVPRILAENWDEIPAHFGARWVEILPRIAELAHQLKQAESHQARSVIALRLAMVFAGHPSLAPRLVECASVIRGTVAGGGQTAGEDSGWHSAVDELRARIDRVATERHTEIVAPRSLAVGERGVLAVRLTRTPLAASVHPVHLTGEPTLPFQVRLYAPAEVIGVEGSSERAVTAAADTDSEPAVFYLRGVRAARAELQVDIAQHGVVLATSTFELAVTSRTDAMAGSPPVVTVRRSALVGADLELRVRHTLHEGTSQLSFSLHSPNGIGGYHHLAVGETRLAGSPGEYQRRVLTDLEQPHGARGARRQRALGEQLYRELLPPALREAYRRISANPELRTLQIVSDEPWIPWELIRPYADDHADPIVDDDHWCVRFEMTRWLAAPHGPPDVVHANSLVFLDAGTPPEAPALPSVAGERAHLRRLVRSVGASDLSPDQADSLAVDALLDTVAGQVGLWHFAGHGDGSKMLLADGVTYLPDELTGPRQTALRTRRPLVFLNACRTAAQDWGWVGLGSWAEAWTGRCGCPFIGPQWQVTDSAAALLATTFYDELAAGRPVGAAMTAARTSTRNRFPHDPTWLAYSVYAHPNTTVRFR